MLSIIMAAQIVLVVFHTVDGHEIAINPKQVTNITASKPDADNKLLVDTVQCIIGMTNGKFHSVSESCEEVKQKLEGGR